MGKDKEAIQEYNKSIDQFEFLAKQYPAQPEFRQALAYSHNWLGETIRGALDKRSNLGSSSDAEKEYSEAIRLQEELHKQEPANALYQQELARTYYNRGIIRYGMHADEGMRSDFRKAIELLEPLISETQAAVDTSENPDPAQDLARVYNNYANVVSSTGRNHRSSGLLREGDRACRATGPEETRESGV